jgi:hypothetical protein
MQLCLQDATLKSCCGNGRIKSEGKNSEFSVTASSVEPTTCRIQAGPISVSFVLGLFSYCFPNSSLFLFSFRFLPFIFLFYSPSTSILIHNQLRENEPFLRSSQLCSYSRIFQNCKKTRSFPLVLILFRIRTTLPAHLILLDLITLILSEECKL